MYIIHTILTIPLSNPYLFTALFIVVTMIAVWASKGRKMTWNDAFRSVVAGFCVSLLVNMACYAATTWILNPGSEVDSTNPNQNHVTGEADYPANALNINFDSVGQNDVDIPTNSYYVFFNIENPNQLEIMKTEIKAYRASDDEYISENVTYEEPPSAHLSNFSAYLQLEPYEEYYFVGIVETTDGGYHEQTSQIVRPAEWTY